MRSVLSARTCHAYLRARRPVYTSTHQFHSRRPCLNHTPKYADKLKIKADEKGVSLDDLKAQARDELQRQEKLRAQQTASRLSRKNSSLESDKSRSSPSLKPLRGQPTVQLAERRDSSPIKPLSSILNIPRLLATPHSPTQINALWTAYHASRSSGTGRGYICATIPIDIYERMATAGSQYPSFVVALPRQKAAEPNAKSTEEAESEAAFEFFFLQWAFHEAPPPPSVTEPDLFAPLAKPAVTPGAAPNPPVSTILFTPLQEYKHRAAFATPYLVLTQHTDLARSHGIVLLRGEITPSSTSTAAAGDMRFMLSQEDAQMLGMAVQKFYLWEQGDEHKGSAAQLLKAFHERPEEFRWEELLRSQNRLV